ncbi:MAG: TonB family protein [Bacteroidetes bacterium]|jgi:protein TonB|nr:TonB family protein [Bacteroidota bacterium]
MNITWNNVVSPQRNELVFEGRNQFYGAYEIRRNYNRVVMFVLAGLLVAVGLIFLIRFILNLNISLADTKKPQIVMTDIDLTPPPIDKNDPPPPPPPPPPVVETVRFVPPVIQDDAVETDPPPPQDELVETNVSTVTQEGTGGDDIVIPTENTGPGVVEEAKPEIFTVVEEMPEYPGGMADLMKYLQNNISYPQVEKEAGIQGKVFVKFVVQPDGVISNVEVLRGVSGGEGLSKEAIRVVKSMPKWKPGKQNGRTVPVYFNLPINFKLN